VIALDRWVGDVSVSLIAVTMAALALGAIWRERAWRWGVVTGLSLPAINLASSVVHHDPLPPTLLYLTAFVPAFVGAYMGAFLNKMVSALRGKED